MKFLKILVIVTCALLVNYSLGWTYEGGKENRTIRNDSVVVAASQKYSRLTPIKWFFLGKNYREEWSMPVAMPVFHLQTTKGGFTIEKMGGGQQTKTLHLVNKNGSEWILRSVDKVVSDEAFPPMFKRQFVRNIVQDQISAAYPYAQLTIHDLSIAVGVPSTTSELYYIPDDPALGQFRPVFAHSVCFLSPKAIETRGISLTDTTAKIVLVDTDSLKQRLEVDNRNRVLQERVLTVRLLDMLIADWDRHKGQWEWGKMDSIGIYYFFPVPEDRDQAYFLSHGALPAIVRLFGMPHLVGFKHKPKRLEKLNHKAHSFDRYYMNELGRSDWERIIKEFQHQMTDDVIHTAIKRLPPETYALSGAEIEDKLRTRRNGLFEHAMKYYEFLNEEVSVFGSVSPEVFTIRNYPDSSVVTVTRANDKKLLYSRTLYSDTKVLNLVNVGKNDRVDTSGSSIVKVQFIEVKPEAAN
jgi:hypothetical protein